MILDGLHPVDNHKLEALERQIKSLLIDTVGLRKQIEQDVYPRNSERSIEPTSNMQLVTQNVPKRKEQKKLKKKKKSLSESKFKGLVFFGH